MAFLCSGGTVYRDYMDVKERVCLGVNIFLSRS